MSCTQEHWLGSNRTSDLRHYRIVNTQIAIAGLWIFINMHRCFNWLQPMSWHYEEIHGSVDWFSTIKLHEPIVASDCACAHDISNRLIQVEVSMYLGQTDPGPGSWDVETAHKRQLSIYGINKILLTHGKLLIADLISDDLEQIYRRNQFGTTPRLKSLNCTLTYLTL